MERDPRINPQAGDVLIFGGPQWQRERHEVIGTSAKRIGSRFLDVVHYRMCGADLECSLQEWRERAKYADEGIITIDTTSRA